MHSAPTLYMHYVSKESAAVQKDSLPIIQLNVFKVCLYISYIYIYHQRFYNLNLQWIQMIMYIPFKTTLTSVNHVSIKRSVQELQGQEFVRTRYVSVPKGIFLKDNIVMKVKFKAIYMKVKR